MIGENGHIIWERRYPISNYAGVTCVAETKDGGFILSGSINIRGGLSKKEQRRVGPPWLLLQPWLIRTNYKGNKLWQVTLEAERSATINNIVIIITFWESYTFRCLMTPNNKQLNEP